MVGESLEVVMYAAIHAVLFIVLLAVFLIGGMMARAAFMMSRNKGPLRFFKCLEIAFYVFAPSLLVPKVFGVTLSLRQAVVGALPSSIAYGCVFAFLIPQAIGTVIIMVVTLVLLITAYATLF